MKRFLPVLLVFIVLGCKKKDEEPPSVRILKPSQGEAFFPDTIEIKVKAEDNEGIDYIEVFVDDISIGKAQKSTATFKWDGTSVPDSSTHKVYAKALDFAGNVGRSQEIEFMVYSGNHPPAIELMYPDSGAYLTTYVCTLKYRGIDKDTFDTLFYNIHMDTLPYPIFKEPVAKKIKDTFFITDSLLPNKRYYWQVVVSDLLGIKDTSKIFYFQTPPLNQKPLPPANISPPDGAVDVDYTPQLSYTSSDPDGDSIYFRVKLDTTNSFADPLINQITPDTFLNISDSLIPGVKYYWQVTVYDEKGDSALGNIWEFTVRKVTLNQTYSITGAWYKDVTLYMDTLFVLKAPNILEIYLNTNGFLTFLSSYSLPYFSYRVYYKPPYILVTYGSSGAKKLGLYKKQGNNITFLDEISLNSGAITEVLFYQDYIYMVTLNGFKILRINSDTLEILKTVNETFQVLDGDIEFSNIYITGESYISAYSLVTPENPLFLYQKTTEYSGLKYISIKSKYLLLSSDSHIILFYITDPQSYPITIASIPITEPVVSIKENNRLFGIFSQNSAYITYPNRIGIHFFSETFYESYIESGYIDYPYFFVVSQNGLYVLKCQKF